MNLDPLAEQFSGWTPYHYVYNNPVNMIDPTGMSAESFDQDHLILSSPSDVVVIEKDKQVTITYTSVLNEIYN